MDALLRGEKPTEVIPFSLDAPVLCYPVRHHSPACAWHLERIIRRYSPDCILVEGPENANDLIPVLTHPDTKAPVALFCSCRDEAGLPAREEGAEPESFRCYYPFLDHSPELTALRAAAARGIPGRFIDLPYGEILLATRDARGLRAGEEKLSYASDRYLSANRFQQLLCEKTGLRGFEEFWEKYFETAGLAQTDEAFAAQLNAYCLLSRQNTPEEELLEDGCLAREAHMALRIREASEQYRRVLVVAGGFHIWGLLHSPARPPERGKLPEQAQAVYPMRYTMPAADALSGYAVPAYDRSTAEELADRIVPDLGFAADGRRVFDYGPRSFTVRLTPTLEPEITNDRGKAVKNLPAPGKTDDEEKASAAYNEFKLMKKQIKTTVTAQKARLEAALSALRRWSADAWRALFVENPIMHQFAMTLIWGVYQDGGLRATFRYMEDGSFNTVDEEEYRLPEDAQIGLAHPVELDADTLAGWKQQLEDYEITQSVLQLDRPVYRPEPGTEQLHSLELFGGKVLNGLSLSGKLLGLGWYRGSVQDGGGFYTFYRENPALSIGVELNFSGCCVGGENDTVTVYDAVFYRSGTVKRGSYCYDTPKEENTFALGDVPPRYYSEIVYQLERATASAAETDPDWKEKR